jgi:hypothetical protein
MSAISQEITIRQAHPPTTLCLLMAESPTCHFLWVTISCPTKFSGRWRQREGIGFARDPRMGRHVAIKISAERLERFREQTAG